MNDTDLSSIRQAAHDAHQQAKHVLERGTQADCEVQRDDCEEKKNAVITVINDCENKLEDFRKMKRAIDNDMAEVRKIQREFEELKTDLSSDFKRLNSQFWDLKQGRKVYDPHPSPNV